MDGQQTVSPSVEASMTSAYEIYVTGTKKAKTYWFKEIEVLKFYEF